MLTRQHLHLSSMAPTALAVALLAGVAFPLMTAQADTTCGSHMQSADPTQVCYDHFGGKVREAQADSDALAAMGAAAAGRKCYRPADLPKGVVATWAVMKRLDGTVVGESFDKAWAEAKAGKAWTVTVCTS